MAVNLFCCGYTTENAPPSVRTIGSALSRFAAASHDGLQPNYRFESFNGDPPVAVPVAHPPDPLLGQVTTLAFARLVRTAARVARIEKDAPSTRDFT